MKVRVSGPKSVAILFSRKLAARHVPSQDLVINGEAVPWKNVVRYLGMQLDKRLTFGPHVQDLFSRTEKAVRCLYPLINRRSQLQVHNRLLMFWTIYRPTFSYGALVFSRCAATHRRKLQVHQNRILKMMLDKSRRFSTIRLHSLAGVSQVEEYLTGLSEKFSLSCQNNVNRDIVDLNSNG